MSLSLKIAGVERKRNVKAFSLDVNKTISKKRNSAKFDIVSIVGNKYKPSVGQEVIISDNSEAYTVDGYSVELYRRDWGDAMPDDVYSYGDPVVTFPDDGTAVATTDLGGGYGGIGFDLLYDMRGKHIQTQVVDWGSATVTSFERYGITVYNPDTSRYVGWFCYNDGGTRKINAVLYDPIDGITYYRTEDLDEDAFEFVRITITDDNVVWENSEDGEIWNFFAQTEISGTGIDFSNCGIEILYGTWQAEASTTSIIYGDIVMSYDVDPVYVPASSAKIFAGVITKIETSIISHGMVSHRVECQDYMRLLDRRLVPDSYKNKTVNEIIAELKLAYFPSDVTINNVDCPILIDSIKFNYIQLSVVLEELAKRVGYEYYIDNDKDLHFFQRNSQNSEIEVNDTNGTYVLTSVRVRDDVTQVRNSIVVRGGDYLASVYSTDIEANGTDVQFGLPYKFSDFHATLTGNELDLGIDYLDDPNNYDALFNFQEKVLKFKPEDKPSVGAVLRISGKPNLPLTIKYSDNGAIETMATAEDSDGIYEYLISDKTIRTKDEARQRAIIEVETYGNSIIEGSFESYSPIFEVGQRIRLNSQLLEINSRYIVNAVRIKQRTPEEMEYSISLVSQKTFDFVDIMKQILIRQTNTDVRDDETIEIIINKDENVSVTDLATTSAVPDAPNYEWDRYNTRWNYFTWGTV